MCVLLLVIADKTAVPIADRVARRPADDNSILHPWFSDAAKSAMLIIDGALAGTG
jgi:hypothetical protein